VFVAMYASVVDGAKPSYILDLTLLNTAGQEGNTVELPDAAVQFELFGSDLQLDTLGREGRGATRAEASGTLTITRGAPLVGAEFCARFDISLSFLQEGQAHVYGVKGNVSTVLLKDVLAVPDGL
jgi:hypothetical protein